MPFPEAMPIKIRGVTYKSSYEAARANNVARSTVYGALERGALDTVGLRGRLLPRPVSVAGKRYTSERAAAKALGLSRYMMKRRAAELGVTYLKGDE